MTTKNKKGFTIIEVVLVLAIAGLIFLMVFIALPALQRSQRNTQREDDLSRFLTAANDYQTNNSGKTPWRIETGNKKYSDPKFVSRYIDDSCKDDGKDCTADQFRDPDGELYQFSYQGNAGTQDGTKLESVFTDKKFVDMNHTIYVWTYASCGSVEGAIKKGTGARQYAILYMEEGNAITCNDNH